MDGLPVVEVEPIPGTHLLPTEKAVFIQQPVVDHLQVLERLMVLTLDIVQITGVLPTLVVVVEEDEVVEL
tara:strand:- start:406 stop:615 length:210 start_codon:yes stop_codon:yes gene_type:complete